jgi:hypothetical protein
MRINILMNRRKLPKTTQASLNEFSALQGTQKLLRIETGLSGWLNAVSKPSLIPQDRSGPPKVPLAPVGADHHGEESALLRGRLNRSAIIFEEPFASGGDT